MRKKILSVALVLCMVLGMMPATFASVATDLGYKDEDVAMTVMEDTTITEDVDGLVLVVNAATVTVTDAKISIGIVVAPGAKGAKIEVAGKADVNAVIVLDTAEVTVAENATAASVTVSAPETKVEVAGTVETVTVAEAAEKTAVTIAETAAVEKYDVAAPEVTTDIAGSVKEQTVAETAKGSVTNVAPTATVDKLTVAAPDTKTNVDGNVGTMDVADTATGTNISGTNAGKVEVTGNTGNTNIPETPEEPEEPTTGTPTTSGSSHEPNPGFVTAPLEDQAGEDAKEDLYKPNSYKVDVTNNNAADNEFNVTITVQDLEKHTNAQNKEDYWVGLSVPVPTPEKVDEMEYKYYVMTVCEATGKLTAATEITSVKDRGNIKGEDLNKQGVTGAKADSYYNTLYFTADVDEETGEAKITKYTIAVVKAEQAKAFEEAVKATKSAVETLGTTEQAYDTAKTAYDKAEADLKAELEKEGSANKDEVAKLQEALAEAKKTLDAAQKDLDKATAAADEADKTAKEDNAEYILDVTVDATVVEEEEPVESPDPGASSSPEVSPSPEPTESQSTGG